VIVDMPLFVNPTCRGRRIGWMPLVFCYLAKMLPWIRQFQ